MRDACYLSPARTSSMMDPCALRDSSSQGSHLKHTSHEMHPPPPSLVHGTVPDYQQLLDQHLMTEHQVHLPADLNVVKRTS